MLQEHSWSITALTRPLDRLRVVARDHDRGEQRSSRGPAPRGRARGRTAPGRQVRAAAVVRRRQGARVRARGSSAGTRSATISSGSACPYFEQPLSAASPRRLRRDAGCGRWSSPTATRGIEIGHGNQVGASPSATAGQPRPRTAGRPRVRRDRSHRGRRPCGGPETRKRCRPPHRAPRTTRKAAKSSASMRSSASRYSTQRAPSSIAASSSCWRLRASSQPA